MTATAPDAHAHADERVAWDPHRLPDQSGRTVLVTGATSGIGYFIAEQLAGAGAHVVLAARDPGRAEAAREAIAVQHPGATTSALLVDLASLDGVRRAGLQLAELEHLDALVLNGAQMRVTRRGEATADGHDVVMGTGHLAGAALVEAALPVLARRPGGRVVGTTSGLVRRLRPAVEDLATSSRPLARAGAWSGGRRYVQSKAVHEAYVYELDRRLRTAGSTTAALLSHPGVAVGSRTPSRPGVLEHRHGERRHEPLFGLVGQGKDAAAWPAVRATTDPAARGGQYWGPTGKTAGPPVLDAGDPRYRDPALGARVWAQTEAVLGAPLHVV
ncbi:SDR family NAD(P)-dependent oxidoreductase [Quadrisphaera sp. KR29]|uniref:SDR family NAD(P)-dependent oxidoreductase n=1 Tax=Quadrisphaera sp. KR29 TaxID=3461391 RepID=UPI004045150B